MRFLAFLSVFCLFINFSFSAQAQSHSGFCNKADSTAAAQECLKKHLDSAQARLNKIYQKLGTSLEAEKLNELKDLQQTWLVYRDAECMWEKERPETPALKIVNELSCMARVTDDRADILSIAYEDGKDINTQRDFGAFPRWMNAAAKDYPDVLWNYGARGNYDLNCDGNPEYIMHGISYSLLEGISDNEQDAKAQLLPQSRQYSHEVVIAIVQNPPVGKPDIKILKFPILDGVGEKTLCHSKISLNFETLPIKEAEKVKDDEKDSVKTCDAILKINDKDCESKTISWNGNDFVLDIKNTKEKLE